MPQADTPNTDLTARIGELEKQIDERQHVQVVLAKGGSSKGQYTEKPGSPTVDETGVRGLYD